MNPAMINPQGYKPTLASNPRWTRTKRDQPQAAKPPGDLHPTMLQPREMRSQDAQNPHGHESPAQETRKHAELPRTHQGPEPHEGPEAQSEIPAASPSHKTWPSNQQQSSTVPAQSSAPHTSRTTHVQDHTRTLWPSRPHCTARPQHDEAQSVTKMPTTPIEVQVGH